MKKVSVIIPTYGKPEYLQSAISSVLNQTYKNIELIVVDDNNPDTLERKLTEEIILNFDDSRILYIKHSKNLNGAVARNTGIKVATGSYIAFLDSDDLFLEDRIEKCVNAIENINDKKIVGVYTGCEFRRNGKVYNRYRNVKSGNFLVDTLACKFMFCTGSNIFVKKEVLDKLCGFDENFLRHQDYEFLVRLFEKYNLLAINDILVIKNNENKNVPDVEKMIDIKTKYLNKYSSIIDNLDLRYKNYIYYSHCIQIVEAAIRSKNKEVYNLYYKKAKKYKSISLYEYIRIFLLKLFVFNKNN